MLLDGRFYTTEELCEKLHTTPREIIRRIKKGYLKAYKIGKSFGVKPEDFETYCDTFAKAYKPKN